MRVSIEASPCVSPWLNYREHVTYEAELHLRHVQFFGVRPLREEREVTTPETLRAERQYVEWALLGRNQHPKLGTALSLPSYFSKDQVKAVRAVLASKDTVTGVVGDAGAGKTSIMPEIIRGIEAASGSVHACALSTSAKAVLQDKITPRADTLQKLLAAAKLQELVKGKVIIVDEARFVSSKQMRDLCQLSERNDNRVILVGDPKQHTSIEAGDAFRAMIKYGNLQVCRLQEIHAFSDVVRDKLKEASQLSRDEKPLETVHSYNWTEVERQNVRNYGPSDAITFHKATDGFARHETAKVIERQKNYLVLERGSGEKAHFTPATMSQLDVGHAEQIGVAPGEKLLIRANFPESKLINGEIVEVKQHLSDGSMQTKDGRTIPATFKQFTYG